MIKYHFPSTQVFSYNGAVNCLSLEYAFFFFSALIVVITFVTFAPFFVGYLCAKRPVVSTRGYAAIHSDKVN